jgi:hypothetical protein
MKSMLKRPDDRKTFAQSEAYAKLTMPTAPRVAAGRLGKIHNDVGRYDIDQIFLRAKTERLRVFTTGVKPSGRYDVSETLKILSVLSQLVATAEPTGQIHAHLPNICSVRGHGKVVVPLDACEPPCPRGEERNPRSAISLIYPLG